MLATCAIAMSVSFAAYPRTSSAASATNYTVVSGDTLWKIAAKFQIGLSELAAANPQLADPNLIYPQQTIHIPGTAAEQSWETQVVDLINAERAKQGLSPLANDWQLARVARYKSEDMRDNNYFSHTSPTYGSPFDMMQSFGISYGYAGENIAAGQTSPAAVVDAWMNSAGHRANILNANYTKIGVGLAQGGSYGYYWTQEFTS
ncbi:MAG: SafA/ExsA family spore coat assembly protein [Paenibacillaceae bacterium]|nr:SafA/ExsA family spore coat assembly protein [Paenibacillaceae bacterium]